jgi:hypothetical protein
MSRRKLITSPGPVTFSFGYTDDDDKQSHASPPLFDYPERTDLAYLSPTKRQRKAPSTGRSRPKNRVSRQIVTKGSKDDSIPPIAYNGDTRMEVDQSDNYLEGEATMQGVEDWGGGTEAGNEVEVEGEEVVPPTDYAVYSDMVLAGALGFWPIFPRVFVVQGWDGKAKRGTVRGHVIQKVLGMLIMLRRLHGIIWKEDL